MAKSVAVVIRKNKGDGLRMAVGLTLDELKVAVFLTGVGLERTEDVEMNIQALREMRAALYTDNPDNPLDYMSRENIAMALADYDAVITY